MPSPIDHVQEPPYGNYADEPFYKGAQVMPEGTIPYDTIRRLLSETDRTCQFSLAHKNEKFMDDSEAHSPRNKPIMG